MVFVTAGMGGGTGTGAAPVIAQIARELRRAHRRRRHQAVPLRGQQARASRPSEGIAELKAAVDTLITIPNQRLLALGGQTTAAARRVPQGRRGAAQRRAGHQRPHHVPRPHQRRLRRRADHHERAWAARSWAPAAAAGEQPRDRGGAAGDQLAAARGRLASTAPPASSSTSPAARDLTLHEVNEALDADPGGGARGREHHLRLGHRRRTLGDEVKITVIATGFMQKEVPIRLIHAAHVPAAPKVAPRAVPASPAQAPIAASPVQAPRREPVPARAPAGPSRPPVLPPARARSRLPRGRRGSVRHPGLPAAARAQRGPRVDSGPRVAHRPLLPRRRRGHFMRGSRARSGAGVQARLVVLDLSRVA